MFGHTHRKQEYTFKRGDGTLVTCLSAGWLGDETQPVFDYMDHDNWAKGFNFVLSDEKGFWDILDISIKDKKAIYNGTLYYN
jgi:hypothetical protein